jgi:hypothetical protein
LLQFWFHRPFLSLLVTHCPPDAGSSFLVILLQSFTNEILSVDGDYFPISIARKSRDHGSLQSEKKPQRQKAQKQKAQETRNKDKPPIEWEWSMSSVAVAASFSQCTTEGAAPWLTEKNDQRVLCTRASWPAPYYRWVASR